MKFEISENEISSQALIKEIKEKILKKNKPTPPIDSEKFKTFFKTIHEGKIDEKQKKDCEKAPNSAFLKNFDAKKLPLKE